MCVREGMYAGDSLVPLANWTNREREEGCDKRARITTKGKKGSSRERAPPELEVRHG